MPVTGKVMDVAVSDKSVAVLFDHKTETYSKWGKLAGSTQDINYNDEIVNILLKNKIECSEYYIKNNWQPHCTISIRIRNPIKSIGWTIWIV